MHDLSELATASREGAAAAVPTKLLAQDQLRQEQAHDTALHHLREGAITFPPTYKYIPGSRDELSSKRVPGWCDRVLYASAAQGEVKVLNYRSVMEFTRSDHKPVSRAAFLPLSATISFELSEESAPRLTGMMAKYQVAAQFLLPRLRSRNASRIGRPTPSIHSGASNSSQDSYSTASSVPFGVC